MLALTFVRDQVVTAAGCWSIRPYRWSAAGNREDYPRALCAKPLWV